jgi:prepilin-type processing-associated H-X9-DG protein
MLLPALGKAKQTARSVQCLSNVKQLQLAHAFAMTEMDWQLEEGWNDGRSSGTDAYADSPWFWQRHYFGNADELMRCPSTQPKKTATSSNQGTADQPWQVQPMDKRKRPVPYVGSYAQNFYLLPRGNIRIDRGSDVTHRAYRTESDIESPSRTPAFADSVYWATVPLETDAPSRNLFTGGWVEMPCLTIARHGGSGPAHRSLPWPKGESLRPYRNNVAFMDGHAESIPLDNLWQLFWTKDWKVPSPRPQ